MINELKEGQVQIGDSEISYFKVGKGSPLILLHGALGTAMAQWGNYIEGLSEKYTVYVMDLRGHGKSSNVEGVWSMDKYEEDLLDFISALEVKRPIICGWSMGGSLALRHALKYSKDAYGYILGGVVFDEEEENTDDLGEVLGISKSGEVDLERFVGTNGELVEWIKTLHRAQGEDYWKSLIQGWGKLFVEKENLDYSKLSSINAKVLIVIGDSDEYIPLESSLELHKRIPNSNIAVLPNATHALTRSHEAEMLSLIMAFDDEDND